MKRIYLLMLLISVSLFAQAQSNLVSSLEALKSQLADVETKSYVISQRLEWEKSKPYKVVLSIDETSKKKGKVKSTSYAFNLQDVDVKTIRSKTNKDVIEVNVFMKSKQKMIAFSEEGKFKNYMAKLKLYAPDPDAGKDIENALKEIVGEAKKMPSECPSSATDGYAWLEKSITDFSTGDVAVDQKLVLNGILVDYSVATKAKSTTEEQWLFNLADLNKRSIKLQIKSKEFFVEAKTKRNKKYVFYKKGEKTRYTSKVKFYFSDFDKAKCMVEVLETLIEDSKKKEKANFPSFSSAHEALNHLAKHTGEVKLDKISVDQELKASCATVFNYSEAKGDSDAKNKEFRFNFIDVRAKKIDITIKGNKVMLELGTSKNKLIQVYKDGELGSYTNKIFIVAKDIESAKTMKVAAVAAANKCEDGGFTPFSTLKENFEWLAKNLKEQNIPDKEQSLAVDGEDCKWTFTSVKSGKKQLEENFEFALADLDAKKVKWDISGKKLAIELTANHQEKVVKYYKNGEPGNYKNTFAIEFRDIESARNAMTVLEKCIALCK